MGKVGFIFLILLNLTACTSQQMECIAHSNVRIFDRNLHIIGGLPYFIYNDTGEYLPKGDFIAQKIVYEKEYAYYQVNYRGNHRYIRLGSETDCRYNN